MLTFAGGGYASPAILGRILSSLGAIEVVYGGDRMSPALRHGSAVTVREARDGEPRAGQVVLVAHGGIPELLRVTRADERGVALGADADPTHHTEVGCGEILAVAELPRRRIPPGAARLRRTAILLREACREGPDDDRDAAATVLAKYDAQSAHYDREESESLPTALAAEIERRVAAGRRILVAGCGTGRECRALASRGYRIAGVDFSETMIALARQACAGLDPPIELTCADLREMPRPASPPDAVLFTPDVYSFLPEREQRVALLRRLAGWLPASGPVFLAARRARGLDVRLLLTVQWLCSSAARRRGWGSSHTRWIDADGRWRRSFIKVFGERQLVREIEEAGWSVAAEASGWLALVRR